jgi:hypothetical protein
MPQRQASGAINQSVRAWGQYKFFEAIDTCVWAHLNAGNLAAIKSQNPSRPSLVTPKPKSIIEGKKLM